MVAVLRPDLPADAADAGPQVRTLLLTDIVDSTALVERLGDTASAQLFRAHDRLVLELQQRWRGRLIDRSDGLLLIFGRALDGLGFALDYVRGLQELGNAVNQPLRARAGLHVGEVLIWENPADSVRHGAKPVEVEGLAKPLAGRLMAMARPGQILLSAVAEPLAHRAARELGERGEQLVWKSHGRWKFKGVPESQEVFEVGEPTLAPLRAPANSPKAWRDLPLWRRPGALVAEVALLAAVAIGLWYTTRPQPAIAFNERDWVVVGDLRNLSGDARLDDALEQAFRISLEQSRYVNVLSDLKVRETLQRMQRKPDTPVDRALGAEIAMRDGVRALILPTVSEVGGRLRVSAEVVDPQSQATVYALSADGKGVDSALGSIDEVTGELREALGEVLQNVEKTRLPLPNVATPSLDALKAFAVARQVLNTTGDRDQAVGLYRRALALDPQFALAHADMGRLFASRGETQAAQDAWRHALLFPQRLSSQEKAWVELMLLQYGPPAPYFRKAEEYLALYPDDLGIVGRLSTNRWHANEFEAAQQLARRANTEKNERAGAANYSLGIYLMGLDQRDAALAAFDAAKREGFTAWGEYHARAYDMVGQFDQSDAIYKGSHDGRNGWYGEAAVVTWILRRDWPQARRAAQRWLEQSTASHDMQGILISQAAMATVETLSGSKAARSAQQALASTVEQRRAAVHAFYPPAVVELQLYAGLLSAYRDDRMGVSQALRRTQGSSVIRDYPMVAQLHQVLLAEQERLDGDPKAAVARLAPVVADRSALVVAHWALQRAAQAAGDRSLANREAQWMQSHPGRIVAESTSTDVLRYFNAGLLHKRAVTRNSPTSLH